MRDSIITPVYASPAPKLGNSSQERRCGTLTVVEWFWSLSVDRDLYRFTAGIRTHDSNSEWGACYGQYQINTPPAVRLEAAFYRLQIPKPMHYLLSHPFSAMREKELALFFWANFELALAKLFQSDINNQLNTIITQSVSLWVEKTAANISDACDPRWWQRVGRRPARLFNDWKLNWATQ